MGKSTFLQDFKAFAMKGNVIDMAVGIIIGGAFGKIVSSMVSDIIMPLVGMAVGGVNFANLKWVLRQAHMEGEKEIAEVAINYGNFIQATIDFLIIALSIFVFIRIISNLNRKPQAPVVPPAPPAPSPEEVLLTQIRDILKDQNPK